MRHITEVFAFRLATPAAMSRVAVFKLPNVNRVRAIHWDSFTTADGDTEAEARQALFDDPQYQAHNKAVNDFSLAELKRIDFQKKEA
jgi:hypothetical protein